MATALFINRTDLVRNTIINGNVDTDTFLQFVNLAQIQHLQIYMGTALYDQVSNAILADTISLDLDDLLKNYLQPMLIHFSMVDYLPFSSFTISQGGLQKHTSENAQQATKDEVDFLIQKHRNFAEFYTRRFIDFMSFNASAKFPKYYENRNDDMYPSRSAAFVGWVL